jgi:hypothetical protein
MSRLAVACLGLLLATTALPAVAQLQVRVEGAVEHPGTLNLKDAARLSDAALAARVRPQAYLLGAAWLRPSLLTEQQRLKAGVLFDLDSLHIKALQHGDDALADTVGSLRQWIAALPVTGRAPALLAPRAVEANARANLPLQPGDRLFYPLRPTTIRIVGAVEHACTVPLQAAQDARRYLAACPYAKRADRDWIYVIQPDGHVFRQGVALWNRSAPLSLAPGATIYVPLPARAAATVDESLNSDLADFLATQVLPGPEEVALTARNPFVLSVGRRPKSKDMPADSSHLAALRLRPLRGLRSARTVGGQPISTDLGVLEKPALHALLPRKRSVPPPEAVACTKPLSLRERGWGEGSATPQRHAPPVPSPGYRRPLPVGEGFIQQRLRGKDPEATA